MAITPDTEPRKDDDTPVQFRFTTGSVLRAVLLGGALYVAFAAATRATDALWWFAQAAVFAALAYPAVRWAGRWVPRFVAILIFTAVLIAVAGATLGFGLVELRDESVIFRNLVPPAMHDLEQVDGIGHLARKLHLADAVDDFADDLVDRFHFEGTDVTGLAMKGVKDVSIGFIVWVLTVMLIFTGPSMANGAIGLLPDRRRDEARTVLATAYDRCTGYFGLTSARAVVVYAVVLGACELLGLDMPALLAVVAALAAYFPYVGIIVGALPIALMALLNGPVEAAFVLVVAVALQALDTVVVQPRIHRRTMELGLFITLVASMFGFALRGAGGAIVFLVAAAMVMAVVQDAGALQSLTGSSERLGDEGHGRHDEHGQDGELEGTPGESVT